METLTALTSRVSALLLNAPAPEGEALESLFAAAVHAPDHGRLRPWRFVVIKGEARGRFGDVLAHALRTRDPQAPDRVVEAERAKPMRAPLIIVVGAAVEENSKIPEVEQIVAVGAATQNMLLAAHALGFGGFWRTGAAAYDPVVKSALGFAASDAIVGFLYIGTVGKPGTRPVVEHRSHVTEWPAHLDAGAT